ncbi:MAG: sugar phosphate isomerase/epimerase [Armatimonadetes bacterium]|nr:sugar phosphate isomerase/epimerase [Armatimonadota bacterium]
MRSLPILVPLAFVAASALGQGPQAVQGRAALPEQRLGWQLACQAWTFRELTVFDTLDMLQKLGIRYVEFFPGQRVSKEKQVGFDHGASPELIAEVKTKMAATGVQAVAYGVVGFGSDEASARKVFEFAKTMGMKSISTEPGEAAMPLLDKLAQEYKIGVGIHNHPKPSHYWSPETVLKVVDGKSTLVGACADTGHWYRSGITPVDGLKQLKGRIVSLHFKDLDADKGDVPFGTGVGDAEGQLRELAAQGFKGAFSIEYERTSGAELVENVRKCVQWFRETARKIAPARRGRPGA